MDGKPPNAPTATQMLCWSGRAADGSRCSAPPEDAPAHLVCPGTGQQRGKARAENALREWLWSTHRATQRDGTTKKKKKRQDLPESLWRGVADAEHKGTCACGNEQRELASPSWGMQPDPAASLASEGLDLPGHVLPRHARRPAAAPAKDAVSQGKAICPLNFGSSSPPLAGAL